MVSKLIISDEYVRSECRLSMAIVTNTERGSMATPSLRCHPGRCGAFAHSIYQLSTAPVGSQWFILVA